MKRSGIEDLFTKSDFQRLLQETGHGLTAEFPHVTNSQYMNIAGYKRSAAEEFYKRANSKAERDFEPDTIANFLSLVEFCKNPDWFSL
jgi:hypothetical protein